MNINFQNQNTLYKRTKVMLPLVFGIASIIFFSAPFVGSAFIGLVCGIAGFIMALVSHRKGFVGGVLKIGFACTIVGLALALIYMVVWFTMGYSISNELIWGI